MIKKGRKSKTGRERRGLSSVFLDWFAVFAYIFGTVHSLKFILNSYYSLAFTHEFASLHLLLSTKCTSFMIIQTMFPNVYKSR